jgi:hypothetical protein
MMGGIFASPIMAGMSMSWIGEMILMYGGILLAAVNLPATLIVSDVILVNEDALFFYSQSFGAGSGGGTFWFPSPWWIFIILYTVLALLLYWLSVRKVRKIANQ